MIELTNLYKLYIHIKTNKIYYVFNQPIINTTNSNDQEIMILYTDGEKGFCREVNEFNRKFKEVTA